MCGIIGVVGARARELDFRKALASIEHRGPDGRGHFHGTAQGVPFLIGHTRLSIVELSAAGAQPMHSADGRWVLTYNGEIYNHLELRNRLVQRNWRGRSDTETLVEAIAEWGIEATLPQLNGMFAFCAMDLWNGAVYLARDPFGIKPLYLARHGEGIAFASEIRALSAIGVDTKRLDRDSLATLLALRFVPSPSTLLSDVERMRPGHYLKLDLPSMAREESSYAAPTRSRFKGNFQDAVEAYEIAFRKAIDRQMMSDVPIGVFLSSGVDSALISAVASQAGAPLKTFTVGYEGDLPGCEISGASETARFLGIPHESIRVGPHEMFEAFPKVVRQIEEPTGTTSILSLWFLSEFARRQVTVVLTGQGSDEPLGGYRRYQGEIARSVLSRVGLERALESLGGLMNPRNELLGRIFHSIREKESAKRFLRTYEMLFEQDRLAITGSLIKGRELQAIQYWLDWLDQTGDDDADRMMRIDSRMNLSDDLLLNGDKISMAFSLEARVPMLDLDLIHLIESLPRKYRVTLGRTKIVHKALASRILPQSLVQRRKLGFPMPFLEWSQTIWKSKIEETLLDPGNPIYRELSRAPVEKLWREHLAGTDHSRGIFTLLSLGFWWSEHTN